MVEAVTDRRDEELLAEHLAGAAGAFDSLVARYADDLYGFLFRFVGSASVADDLVQETFLQVHLAAGAFDSSRSFRPWLYTIAANKARDYLRGRGRRTEQSLDAHGPDDDRPGQIDSVASEGASPVEAAGAEETKQTVRVLISRMPENLRLILMLGYYEQLPYADIAEILGIPIGTVKSRLHAAVTQFAKLWQGHTRAATTGEK
jgi:RNA polymerase sigma-70 factor, ECF subfamily